MRALVVHGPHDARVDDVPVPEPAAGELLVRVDRAGICGTDVELFTGEMAYYAAVGPITRCGRDTSGPAP